VISSWNVLKNRALLALMLGHFTNDMFAAVLPILYPLVKRDFAVGNAQVGLLTFAYTIAASVPQPLFGHFADRFSARRLAPLVLIWSTVFVSSYGLASSYGALLALASLAGFGSAAYHPLGAAGAARVTAPEVRNTALSLYTVGGTSGFAVGPLVAVVFVGWLGREGTLIFLIPGAIGAMLLFRQLRTVAAPARTPRPRAAAADHPEGLPIRALAQILAVVMLRSWSFLALVQFIPVWYDDLGYGRGFYGPLTTTVIFAGVVGTLVGGALADRIGGRTVIIGSQILCVPTLLLFVAFPGPAAFLLGAAFGFASDTSLSVTLSAAQRLLPGRTGVVSGIILGLGFLMGGAGVPLTGAMSDRLGFEPALMALATLSAIGLRAMYDVRTRLSICKRSSGAATIGFHWSNASRNPSTSEYERVMTAPKTRSSVYSAPSATDRKRCTRSRWCSLRRSR